MSVANDVRPFLKSFEAFFHAAAKSYTEKPDFSTQEKVDALFKGLRSQMDEVQKFIGLIPPSDE